MDHKKLTAILKRSLQFFYVPPDVNKLCLGNLSVEVRAGEDIYSATIDDCKPGIWRTVYRSVPESHHDVHRHGHPNALDPEKFEIVLWWVADGEIHLDNVVPDKWDAEQKKLDGQYPMDSLDRTQYNWRRCDSTLSADGGMVAIIAMTYLLDDTRRRICGAVDVSRAQAIRDMELYLESLNLCGNDINTPEQMYGYTLGGSSCESYLQRI